MHGFRYSRLLKRSLPFLYKNWILPREWSKSVKNGSGKFGKVKGKVLHTSIVTYTTVAYPGFLSMKQLGVLLLPLDGMLVHCRLPSSISSDYPGPSLIPALYAQEVTLAKDHLFIYFYLFTLTVHQYPFIPLGGESHCESKEHNTMTRPGLEPKTFDLESSTLPTTPLHLPYFSIKDLTSSFGEFPVCIKVC